MCCNNSAKPNFVVSSIPWDEIGNLASRPLRLSGDSGPAMLHMTSDQDVFVSRSIIDDTDLTLHLAGRIALIEFDATIKVHCDSAAHLVTITASLAKPIEAGPYTWEIPVGHPTRSVASFRMEPDKVGCAVRCAKPLADAVLACVSKLPDKKAFLECLKDQLISHTSEILMCLLGCIV